LLGIDAVTIAAPSPTQAAGRQLAARRRLALPVVIFAASLTAYLACGLGAVLVAQTGLRILLAVLAGVFIANLAIIGHDAVHRSFTRIRWLNRLVGTVAFLPALHPYGRWEHHHNRVHHCYTAQIGVDNAYSPMTPDQYRAASPAQRLHYRFMRSLLGQPFFYLVDIWAPSMFFPYFKRDHGMRAADWRDLFIVYAWLALSLLGLGALDWSRHGGGFGAALWDGALFGLVIPFLTWNVFIAFVTIVQHTGPRVRWLMPTGRFSTHQEKLDGTVHLVFPEVVDWFFHRVMQHIVHHVNPLVPLYDLKETEREVIAAASRPVVETWTPLYHWRMTRDCKLYDPERNCWLRFPQARRGVTALPAGAN
jgi:omega-6 fatty acid desaturase (delta-12 desaturase)